MVRLAPGLKVTQKLSLDLVRIRRAQMQVQAPLPRPRKRQNIERRTATTVPIRVNRNNKAGRSVSLFLQDEEELVDPPAMPGGCFMRVDCRFALVKFSSVPRMIKCGR